MAVSLYNHDGSVVRNGCGATGDGESLLKSASEPYTSAHQASADELDAIGGCGSEEAQEISYLAVSLPQSEPWAQSPP